MNISHSIHNNFGIKWKLIISGMWKKETNEEIFFAKDM